VENPQIRIAEISEYTSLKDLGQLFVTKETNEVVIEIGGLF
jgi:hypothetical protein